MPYESITDLPANIKKMYSDKAQEAFMSAFNAIMKQTNDEPRAFAGAHMAAKKIDSAGPPPFVKAEESVKTEGDSQESRLFIEAVFLEAPTYDESTGVYKIPTRLITPGWSRNNFYYRESVLAKVPELMEGRRAYIDHEKKSEIKDRGSRSLKDVAGWYTEVRQESDGAIHGNLNLVETPLTEHAIKLAKANPELVQLSINAQGKAVRGEVNGKKGMIAESFDEFSSTDLVCEAAAGGEITRMVASVAMDHEQIEHDKTIQEANDVTDEEKKAYEATASWLIAEGAYRARNESAAVAEWIMAERSQMSVVEAWLRSEREIKMGEVPEDYREVTEGMTNEQVGKFVEGLKKSPAIVKGNPPAASGEKEPEPGQKGYKRKLL